MADVISTALLKTETQGEEKVKALSGDFRELGAAASSVNSTIADTGNAASKSFQDVSAKAGKALEDMRKWAAPELTEAKPWEAPKVERTTDTAKSAAALKDFGMDAAMAGVTLAAGAATVALAGLSVQLKVMSDAVSFADQWAQGMVKSFGQAQRAGEDLDSQQKKTSTATMLFGKQAEQVQFQVQKATTDYAMGAKRTSAELGRLGLDQERIGEMMGRGEFTPTGLLKYFVGIKEQLNQALATAGTPEGIAEAKANIAKLGQDIAVTFGRAMEQKVMESTTGTIAATEAAAGRFESMTTATQAGLESAQALNTAFGELFGTMGQLRNIIGETAAPAITSLMNTISEGLRTQAPTISTDLGNLAAQGFKAIEDAIKTVDLGSAAQEVSSILRDLTSAVSGLGSVLKGIAEVINTLMAIGQGLTTVQSKIQEFGREYGPAGIFSKIFGAEAAKKFGIEPGKTLLERQAQAAEDAKAAAAAKTQEEISRKAAAASAAKLPETPAVDIGGIFPSAGEVQAAASEFKSNLTAAVAAPAPTAAEAAKPAAAAAAPAALDMTAAAQQFAAALAGIDLTPAATTMAQAINSSIDLTPAASTLAQAINSQIDFTQAAAGVPAAITAGLDFTPAAANVPATINAGIDFTAAASGVASTINSGVNFSAAAQGALATLNGVNWSGAAAAAGATIAAAIRGAASGIKINVAVPGGIGAGAGAKSTGRDEAAD